MRTLRSTVTRMFLVISAALLFLPLFAVPSLALAQNFPRPKIPDNPEAEKLMDGLPTELLGNQCSEDNPFAPERSTKIYWVCDSGFSSKKPGVEIRVLKIVQKPTNSDLVEYMRKPVQQTFLKEVISEHEFTSRGDDNILGVRGFYQAMLGVRITWAAWKDGVLVTVVVKVFDSTDFKKLIQEIEHKVYRMPRFIDVEQTEEHSHE